VIVMDLHMPGLNGIEATRRVLQTSPHINVLVLTMLEDDASVFAAMRAGARGYLLKDADQDEIVRAIRAVGSGEAIFGPTIAKRVMEYFAAPRPSLPPQAFPQLTARERELLELIAQGHSNQAIAERLALRHKTVRNHVSNIFSKLQVADRAQANRGEVGRAPEREARRSGRRSKADRHLSRSHTCVHGDIGGTGNRCWAGRANR
jgi:DNA-binding NarL/FixJ family response regulator